MVVLYRSKPLGLKQPPEGTCTSHPPRALLLRRQAYHGHPQQNNHARMYLVERCRVQGSAGANKSLLFFSREFSHKFHLRPLIFLPSSRHTTPKITVFRHVPSPQPTQRSATLCMQSEALYARRPRREDGVPARSPPHSYNHSHQLRLLRLAPSSLRPLPTEPIIGGSTSSISRTSSNRCVESNRRNSSSSV